MVPLCIDRPQGQRGGQPAPAAFFIVMDRMKIDPINYKSNQKTTNHTNRSDSIQIDPILQYGTIDPILYKSIRFHTNRSDPLQIDPIHH